jgi:hypothetical protein
MLLIFPKLSYAKVDLSNASTEVSHEEVLEDTESPVACQLTKPNASLEKAVLPTSGRTVLHNC